MDAATAEFAERGYDGGRIDAIARRAGVNKALLYYYFPSKGELYRRLVLEHLAAAATALERAGDEHAPPAESIERMVLALFRILSARPQISDFVMREVLNGWGHLEDEDFAIVARTSQPIAGAVERGIKDGRFRDVPPLFVHLLVMASLNFFMISRAARARGARLVGNPMIDPSPEDFARFVVDLVTRGLAAPPGAPTTPGAHE
ncbi:MAG: TetR family transcriptional regulator [Candidatus Eisenbacteria bacterium]